MATYTNTGILDSMFWWFNCNIFIYMWTQTNVKMGLDGYYWLRSSKCFGCVNMKLSEYFQIIKPEYVYLRIIPNNSIRNYNTDKIAKTIHSMNKTILRRIRKQENKIFYDSPTKISYYIYIEKHRVEFYFIIPKIYLNLFKEKIIDTWKSITIIKSDKIPTFSEDALKYQLSYSKEDAMSLFVDKRSNMLLESIVNVIEVLEEGDKVGIFYNFIPISQLSWRSEYNNTIEKLNKNQPIDRQKISPKYFGKIFVVVILEISRLITDIMADLFGNNSNSNKKVSMLELAISNNKRILSEHTTSKKNKIVVGTQILTLSDSNNNFRRKNNIISVCESFKSISSDNELVYKPYKNKKSINFTDFKISRLDTLKTSVDECQNFIQIPGREILENYKIIDRIETQETEVPKELQQGVMCIGINEFRGKKTKAYITNDKEYRNLTLVLIAPTRAGKTTLLQNLCNDALNNGECVIIPDFISNNQLSSELEYITKQKKIIDCGNLEKLEGLGFNETWGFAKTSIEKYDLAKEQTIQLLNLIDCINESDKSLSAKMDRYLEAAANIVFVSYGSVGNVYDVLRNHHVRSQYIHKIPNELKQYFKEYIDTLNEINEYNKDGEIIGTRLNPIVGILDRFNRLKKNTAMEIMLKKDCKNNINLLQEIQKPQIISIKMPERRYKTEQEKDFLTTYWVSKLWQTLQIRDDLIKDRNERIKVNLIIDELYQVPQAQRLLTEKLSQMAKFDCKLILSCHYLGQIPIIRNELKAANTSYMLISGCDKDNYKELKEELYPYELEDLLNLKRYNSLNLIKYEGGYAKFITQLPSPI